MLEITERDMLKEQEATQLFAWLHSVGIEIAIDAAPGTARYYPERFTLDYLKIDRGFINAIGTETITSPGTVRGADAGETPQYADGC